MSNTHVVSISVYVVFAAVALGGCIRQSATQPSSQPDASDAVVWVEENIEHDGAAISLGFRKSEQADGWFEPVAKITRDGKSLANAMVFNSLVSVDGREAPSAEAATVYDTSAGTDSVLYAQGKLPVAAGASQCVVRFRIILPDGGDEWTREMAVDLP